MNKLKRSASSSGEHAGLWRHLQWPLIALAIVLAYNFIFTPGFWHLEIKNHRLFGSLIDILNRGAPVMLLSLGMTLVIATGGVDLSVGAIMAVTSSVAALCLTEHHLGFFPTLVIGLSVGLVAGGWNGALVAYLDLQPIVATLILMVAGRGIAQLLNHGQIIPIHHAAFEFLGGGYFLGFPFSVTVVAIMLALAALVLRRTALGLFVEAIGNNETASRYTGLNSHAIKIFVYVSSGLSAGLAGLLVASDIKAADANNAGLWLELDAILAVVVGGTSLAGGRFYLLSSICGALLIQALTTTILTKGVPVEFTLVVKALVILLVCLLQAEAFRRSAQRGWKRLFNFQIRN